MGVSGGPYIVRDSSLVLELDAADRNSYVSGSLIWSDLSQNENSGSLINGTTYQSASLGSLSFDGIDDYVRVKSLNLQTDFTIEVVASINPLSTNQSVGFFGQGTLTTNSGLHLIYNSGSRGFIFGMYNNDIDTNEAYRPNPYEWFQVCYTYNNTSFQKYVYANGKKLTSTTFGTQAAYLGTGQVNIGAAYGSPQNFLNGKIAYCRLYTRELSSQEILQNYNAQKSRFGLK